MIKPRIVLVLLLISISSVSKMYGQDYSKNSLFVQYGFSAAENRVTDGLGLSFGIGYQHNLWKNRLRYVPSFTFGKYNNNLTTDVADAYFTSISLKNDLNFDVLKIKSFSVVVGTGLTINYSSGLQGSGGYDPYHKFYGGYFNNGNIAINASLGFRLRPLKRRFAYELNLFEASLPNGNTFSEVTLAQFRLIFNLNNERNKE